METTPDAPTMQMMEDDTILLIAVAKSIQIRGENLIPTTDACKIAAILMNRWAVIGLHEALDELITDQAEATRQYGHKIEESIDFLCKKIGDLETAIYETAN